MWSRERHTSALDLIQSCGMRPVRKSILVPADKSISHRALLIGALSRGRSRIRGLLDCADTRSTLRILHNLGVEIREHGGVWVVDGVGLDGFRPPSEVLNAGNSGTTMRIGAGLLAARPFEAVMTGDESLRRRPMDRVVRPLVRMGARIRATHQAKYAPLVFSGGYLHGMALSIPQPSAQVKSAVLLAGLRADGAVTVQLPGPSRDHTERMLAMCGASIETLGAYTTRIYPASSLAPLDIAIPGDFSSAAFFVALAAALPGSELVVRNVGVNPTRVGLLRVLRRMGADIELREQREWGGEPVADLVVHGQGLRAAHVAPSEVPLMIDEVPALCVAASLAEGRTTIRGASELRVKESDRISALTEALGALGIRCSEFVDGLSVEGPVESGRRGCPSGPVPTRGDHRIAMAAATIAAALGIPCNLDDPSCVAVSYPGFLEDLHRVTA